MALSAPYHDGEIAIQERYGDRPRALGLTRALFDAIPAGSMSFLREQQICVLGAAAGDGAIWATTLFGAPGFMEPSDDGKRLHVSLAGNRVMTLGDPVLSLLRDGAPVGSLQIDLTRRTRLRVNGLAREVSDDGFVIEVERAYPNCPKYIQRRAAEPQPAPATPAQYSHGTTLTSDHLALIASADTFFIASSHPEGPVDASHRGGAPGFVELHGSVLRFADYVGNAMYNTLGNLHLNPRAGLSFVDFDRGLQLHLTGTARLDLQQPGAGRRSTGRWVEFSPTAWVTGPIGTTSRWVFQEASPFNP
ncbi:hypothetical protein SAMN05443999_103213 [Roseovarius azorensis]|uniref:Pyridoxamine 5'-phosphate oxidase N-terminal domain-containing protein n=1 Tax=Roseovarius azorensis TaxID=1287727 RepID=A0A1H7M5W6_9RHOB|nr:pyridoxamine 5'-phosphate oxidase family protein [Roseovarius azorensis]SEL06583.1 hypothetical protein SAMN05443999_103213 [Roseovarius azorensis]